jgi:pimeloyl-ACP methyl ester carboxylesterase
MDVPQTRYARTADGLYIAYQVVTEGEHDLIVVPGTVTNIEVWWENERWAKFWRTLGSFSRLIMFDRRGNGLSDRPAGVPPLEQRMDDVRAVMDAVGSERAALLGVAADGAMTALFAATYPERSAALVLYSVPPRVTRAPDYPWGVRAEEVQQRIDDLERGFDEPDYWRENFRVVAGAIVDDEAWLEMATRLVRLSVSPGAYAALIRMNAEIDIRSVLPTIRVPTLVLHRRNDPRFPPDVGRYVAEQIPRAEYRELEGDIHNPWHGDTDAVVDAIRDFVERVWSERSWEDVEPDRVLATVLFTDIVEATQKAVELGDAEWRELLREHHNRIRGQLARFRGREIDTAGDGFFASFDGPARGIQCARAIVDSVRELGIDVRAGLHAGECEVIEGKVGGIAVHTGARVASEAAPGEVLVSSTVKDLVAGSGLRFGDRGRHALKGLGDWHLYAVLRD